MTEKRLTMGGERLRVQLDMIHAQRASVNQSELVIYGVADRTGAEIGVVRLVPKGWEIGATVRAAVRDGQLDPGVSVVFMKRL